MIVDVVYGFLGAGKTTFIKYLLEHPPECEKLVILVNEFGEVGVDGLLLANSGGQLADVVEMPSGCICCTMSTDFRRQFLDIHERYSPDRMIIEPTGVATISQIVGILEREDLEPLYAELRLIHILDSSEFLSFVKSHRYFVENQIRATNLLLLNKTARIRPRMVELLVDSVKEINPEARVYPTSFARLDPAILAEMLQSRSGSERKDDVAHQRLAEQVHDDASGSHYEHEDGMDEEHGLASEYQHFGKRYGLLSFNQECLRSFFGWLGDRKYGDVVRAKGVFRTSSGWIKLELASGEMRVDGGPDGEESIVSIIGRFMNTQEMEAKLRACASG